MIVVGGSDDAFAMPLGVAFYSALTNLHYKDEVSLYIFDGGISPENKRRLARVLDVDHLTVDLNWLEPDFTQLQSVKTTDVWSLATYFSLLVPEQLPEHVNKAIYLDADLVVERDLSGLWDKETADASALAVQDYCNPYVSSPDGIAAMHEVMDLKPDAIYCNAGLMVMNLTRWREKCISAKALHYAADYADSLKFVEQDLLNAAIAGRWKLLDPRWNVATSAVQWYGRYFDMNEIERQAAQDRLLRDAFIYHYTGTPKPWDVHYEGPAQDRFFHYLKESGWFNPAQYALWVLRRKARRAIAEGIPQDLRLRLRQWRYGAENT